MLGKTHSFIGIATTLFLFPPKNIIELMEETTIAIIGAGISDVDISASVGTRKIIKYSILFCLLGIVLLIHEQGIKNINLTTFQIAAKGIWFNPRMMFGILMLVFFAKIGTYSGHRTFTHSLLFMWITAWFIYCINAHYGIWYIVSFMSHIALDLLNKKPVLIFYPMRTNSCFYLCKSDGTINKILLWAGMVTVSYFTVFYAKAFLPEIRAYILSFIPENNLKTANSFLNLLSNL